MSRAATSVTITDPLVKYKSLVAAGLYSPDAGQHRLALHLQKLYLRLQDYTPPEEYRRRLQQLTQAAHAARRTRQVDSSLRLASPSHPIRNNPLFARFFQRVARSDGPGASDTLALTRLLTSHEAAVHLDSPKGLFLSGEVGTGKSMLLDLLADGLPASRRRRWHFSAFMLHALARLEQFRASSSSSSSSKAPDQAEGREHSLLWLARDLIEQSPILFLDEFQLPDRAASKILRNLLIPFFQLGGVLVASSNRVPEELEKATGSYCSPAPADGLLGTVLGMTGRRRRRQQQMLGELYGPASEFSVFLDVLKARCDFWHMEGARDWRRRDAEPHLGPKGGSGRLEVHAPLRASGAILATDLDAGEIETDGEKRSPQRPPMYFMPSDGEQSWRDVVPAVESATTLEPATLVVYGRTVTVPRQRDGVCYWVFSELVSSFGPADYISLASTFHTFVVDSVPVLTVAMRNQARRFITLIDALYEARCRLIMRADAGADDLFFPETRGRVGVGVASAPGESPPPRETVVLGDATYSETIAEVFQDQTSPFRPNISAYAEGDGGGSGGGADPSLPMAGTTAIGGRSIRYDPDQDSDFGSAGDEESCDTMVKQKAAAATATTATTSSTAAVDFGNAAAFTGEDERFAYRRATSRLWELCGASWHAKEAGAWWRPLPREARHWEGSAPSVPLAEREAAMEGGQRARRESEIAMGPATEVDGPLRLDRFRAAPVPRGKRRGGCCGDI